MSQTPDLFDWAAAARPRPGRRPGPRRGGRAARLVDAAGRALRAAVYRLTGCRWACRGDQDCYHEGDHCDAVVVRPVRLTEYLRGVYLHLLERDGRPPADDRELVLAALALMAGWEDAHDRHLFGQPVDPAAVRAEYLKGGGALPPLVHGAEAADAAAKVQSGARPATGVRYFRRHPWPAARRRQGDAAFLTTTLDDLPDVAGYEQVRYAEPRHAYAVPPAPGGKDDSAG